VSERNLPVLLGLLTANVNWNAIGDPRLNSWTVKNIEATGKPITAGG
jgi:hypothetical protein